MVGSRVDRYVGRISESLRGAIAEDRTPRETAGSFALGTFITMLPTLGTGLLLFAVIAVLFDRVSRIALFASVVVFNPVVKWGVYAASFALGSLLLGPAEGTSPATVSLDAGPDILARLLLGNLILAAAATAIGYVAVHRLAVAYRGSEVGAIIEETVEELVEETVDH